MKSFIMVMLAALSLGTAYGMPTDRVLTKPAVAPTQCQSASTVSFGILAGRLVTVQAANRGCDYKCLDDCRADCREQDLNNDEYNLCMDQCLGICDCR